MKAALVHDWLTTMGGAEKVLEAILDVIPSDLFTLVKNDEKLRDTAFARQQIKTSFIQKLPFAKKKYRSYLPLFPIAIEQFDLANYDIIVSSSHAVAKGVITHSEQLHICYCHTPMRYAWELYHRYLKESDLKGGVKSLFAKGILHYMRMWDISTINRAQVYVANSNYIARRINQIYKVHARVINPPICLDFFDVAEDKQDFYVTASRMVSYKKMDLIVEAFSQMPDKKLIVVGEGPELQKIKEKAKANIEIIGYVEDEKLKNLLQQAKGFVFAALEDFGILPVEAQACGTPVIAFGAGGALETVIENETGVFFKEQSVGSIIDAINRFEKCHFDPIKIRAHAEKFDVNIFKEKFKNLIEEEHQKFCASKLC